MLWSEVWHGEDAKSAFIRAALTPLSWLYTFGWNTYAATYRLHLKRPKSPHRPIVCVGNLTVGGSGKTPVTLHLARVISDLGMPVVISCSGYGSPASEEATLAPDGPLPANRWGDEPAMIRWLLPETPLIIGRNRVRAAQICHDNFAKSVLVMDDGFQHLPLAKQVTVLLDPPTANRRCLPAGPYREPMSHRKLADIVLPGTFEVVPQPLRFRSPDGSVLDEPGVPVDVLCALGRPDNFLAALRNAGVSLATIILKPDHDPLTAGNLFEQTSPGEPIVVTAKDWVKLRERPDIERRNIVIARQDVTIEPADKFRTWLEQRLDEVEPQA